MGKSLTRHMYEAVEVKPELQWGIPGCWRCQKCGVSAEVTRTVVPKDSVLCQSETLLIVMSK